MKKMFLGIMIGACLMFTAQVFADDGLQKVEAYLRPSLPITLNGSPIKMDHSPVMYDGSTNLNLRDIARLFGVGVNWNDATQTVELTTSGSVSAPAPSTAQAQPAAPTSTPTPVDRPVVPTKTKVDSLNAMVSNGVTYIMVHDIEDKYYEQGYAFKFDVDKQMVYLAFNPEKGHPVDKYQVVSDGLPIKIFDGASYIELAAYQNSVIPLIK